METKKGNHPVDGKLILLDPYREEDPFTQLREFLQFNFVILTIR